MLRAVAPRVWAALGARRSSCACSTNSSSSITSINIGTARGSGFSSSSGGEVNIDEETAAINDAFAEAREEIADARDDAETVYFNESAGAARDAVGAVLARWDALLACVPEPRRGELVRSMGLKMEQLKAELKELDELHA